MSGNEGEVERFLAAWFEVRQLIQSANFNHFHQAGLSATQFMTLNILPEEGESISIGELARRMNLKPSTVARTIDSLEERAMVTRTKHASDGRVVMVGITAEGKQLQNSAKGRFRDHIADIFSAVPAADRKALIGGLESLVRAAAATAGADGADPAKRSSRQSGRP
jgi:DNA-binding MarR family transcriptional regulator